MAGRSLISGDEETDQSNSNRHVVGQNEVVKDNYSWKKKFYTWNKNFRKTLSRSQSNPSFGSVRAEPEHSEELI